MEEKITPVDVAPLPPPLPSPPPRPQLRLHLAPPTTLTSPSAHSHRLEIIVTFSCVIQAPRKPEVSAGGFLSGLGD